MHPQQHAWLGHAKKTSLRLAELRDWRSESTKNPTLQMRRMQANWRNTDEAKARLSAAS